MTDINHPKVRKEKIIKATLIAFAAAIVLLFVAVLPAEYGIDPTGAGSVLGFTALAESNLSTGMEGGNENLQASFPELKLENVGSGPDVPKPKEANNPPPENQYEVREDDVQIVVPAGKGVEYKVQLLKHGTMKYEWKTDNGFVFFDFHGEVKGNNSFFESYTISNATNVTGTFLAPFEGKHGWYFKNNGNTDVVTNIRLKGEYVLLKQ